MTSRVYVDPRRLDKRVRVEQLAVTRGASGGQSKAKGFPYAYHFVAGDDLFTDYQADLARAKNQQKAQKQEAIVVSITADGKFEIDGTVIESAEMEARLCNAVRQGRDTLHVRADKQSKHEELVQAMDVAKTCGFEKLGILHQN